MRVTRDSLGCKYLSNAKISWKAICFWVAGKRRKPSDSPMRERRLGKNHSNPDGCKRKNRSAPNLCRKLKCKQLYKHFLMCLTYALYAAQAYVACVCVCVWCMFKICVCKCLCICYVLCIMYTHMYEWMYTSMYITCIVRIHVHVCMHAYVYVHIHKFTVILIFPHKRVKLLEKYI
jgi:hypothetical protein